MLVELFVVWNGNFDFRGDLDDGGPQDVDVTNG